VECLAVVVERDHPGNLLAHGIDFRIAQLFADGLSQQLQPVARLPRLNPYLPLIVAVKAECQSHDAVEAALVAMAETHQCNLAKVEWTLNGQMRRHHDVSLRDGSDTCLSHSSRIYPWDVPVSKQRVSSKHRLVKLSLPLLGMGIVGMATLAGAVGFVRSTAAGHIYTESEVPTTPVALVLGAQVNPDGTPSGFLAARLDLAKRLYDAGLIEMIIVSGDHLAVEFDEPAAMRNYLLDAGLPAEKVIADPGGFDTYESCLRAKRVFNLSQLIIVTQSYHLVRAVATCRALGVDAIGVGDNSARQRTIAWWRGAIRDQLACLKTVVDLATRPDPKAADLVPAYDPILT
jgi:vancomycin permeability regulator SanA